MGADDIYTSGKYHELNQTWHLEDSPWKADLICRIIQINNLAPTTIAEIGCGAGGILAELSRKEVFAQTRFSGWDISPQAIQIACKTFAGSNVEFHCGDLLCSGSEDIFDILLVIDVFEHIPDYMGFLERTRLKAQYKVFHIPLDIHASSVIRNTLNNARKSVGHLHFFTADLALAALQDTGYQVMDYFYTDGAIALSRLHPSLRTAAANVPRRLLSKFNLPLTARLLGGYSLLVLAR